MQIRVQCADAENPLHQDGTVLRGSGFYLPVARYPSSSRGSLSQRLRRETTIGSRIRPLAVQGAPSTLLRSAGDVRGMDVNDEPASTSMVQHESASPK